MWWGWAVVAATVLAYAAFSHRLDKAYVTAPMIFVTLGAVVADDGFGLVKIELDGALAQALFKTTLALLLFVEAASIDPKVIKREAGLISRLLGPGMLLAIAGGAAFALAFFDVVNIWEAAIIGAILAPTDAALGLAVVSNKRVPGRMRRGLVVESGLNDGLALPLALAFTAAALADLGVKSQGDAWTFMLEQIGFGVAGGVILGLAAGALLRLAVARDWARAQWLRISPLAATLLAYAGAEAIDGNGFISAWVAGLVYGYALHSSASHVEAFGERLGAALTAVSFFVFGAALLAPSLSDLTWEMVAYGLISLAVVRPAAVAVAMLGSRMRWQTRAFLGWFGPRGIASIIIASIVVKDAGLADDSRIVLITSVTVGLSVYLHGLTAVPGARWYARWSEREPPSPVQPSA